MPPLYPFRRRLLPGWAVAVCLLTLAVSLPLNAQTTAKLTGRVTDSSGQVILAARVTARQAETSATRSTVTDHDGHYFLADLPVGTYEVRAEFQGFRPVIREKIRLVVGETTVVDFTLQVGTLEDAIRVTAEAPLVNLQSAELSYLVSEGAIRELPLNGRNYTDLALLQPGVIAFPHRDGGSVVAHGLATSINGQDPRSNVYLLDGTPQNDFTNGPAGSAASTALGMETIQEFRVEANAYSAEFGRNSGGQVNVVTKSGSNELHGSVAYYHRNDNLDARNFFDPPRLPEFKRNQFGATAGGPLRRDKSFFFAGYESLRERLGRTISTVVPDDNARQGILPAATSPCTTTTTVTISPTIAPYLAEIPVANGAIIPDINGCPTGLAAFTFPFAQTLDQDFTQFRYDHILNSSHQFFARYTYDGAEQRLPTDFPQFPRSFLSRNQFFTGEYRHILSETTLHTFRLNFSRTRVGQDVEANISQPLTVFVSGRSMVGDIDIGGMPRFGPQTSVNVQLTQNVIGGEYGLTHSRGHHLIKIGGLVERYQDNLFNPTFSLGIFTFANVSQFLQNRPLRFLGLTPAGELDRYWRFTLFGMYVQDDFRIHPRVTVNAGLRYEFATLPEETKGRDVTLLNLTDAAPTIGPLYQNPTYGNVSPRLGLAWDVFGNGRMSVRAGYGLYFNTNNHQNLIVTITNPPFTPRAVIAPPQVPTFPQPNFGAANTNTIRPIEFNLKNPNVQIWNLSVQQEFWGDLVVTVGYAGARGIHLLRSMDVNTPTPQLQPDGTVFYAAGLPRPNPNFSTIELKKSDGNSWYNALVFEVRKRWGRNVNFQSSYTFSRNMDTTQASTFFSDATNGTTTAFPEPFGMDYNKGLADFHAKHNWVMNFTWRVPFAEHLTGTAAKLLDGWQFAGITTVRSGSPLTVFVQGNRSRSLWSPSLAPGIGFDRPNWAPGRGPENAVLGLPNRWFDPAAFVLQPAGTLGTVGRGALIGPNLRSFDLALVKDTTFEAWGRTTTVQFRTEAFNLFNRTNLGTPALIAFAGSPATPPTGSEPVLGSFGRIRSTVTSSRQIQLGLRILF